MTARRRRKSGSGPSATALIAWVGGARAGNGASPVAPATGNALASRSGGGRAIFLGRACGLAAGTLLACGSVLAAATHVGVGDGEGAPTGDRAPLLNPASVVPEIPASAPVPDRADPPAEPASAAPDTVSAQGVSTPGRGLHPPLGRVHRNAPVTLDMVDMPVEEPSKNPPKARQPWESPPASSKPTPQRPIKRIDPVLDPAKEGVGKVAPVGGILPPSSPNTPSNSQVPTNPTMPTDLDSPTEPHQARTDGAAENQPGNPQDRQVSGPRDKRTGNPNRGPVQTVQKVVAPVSNTIDRTVKPLLPIG